MSIDRVCILYFNVCVCDIDNVIESTWQPRGEED